MERLFQLLKTHRNDVLEYGLNQIYLDSLEVFKNGVEHVEDDLVRFIQEWDGLLVDVSEKEDTVGRIFESYLQIGLSLQTFIFSYIASQSPDQHRDFVRDYLAIALDIDKSIVNPSNGKYFDRGKLEGRCREFASGSNLPTDELREVGNLIDTKYDEFFQVHGRDYQRVRKAGSEELDFLRKAYGDSEKNWTDEEVNDGLTEIYKGYGGNARVERIKLVFKVSHGMVYSKNLLCEVLK